MEKNVAHESGVEVSGQPRRGSQGANAASVIAIMKPWDERVMMTALAFIIGVLPLVFATGAGAAARRSIGTTVFGGMVLATFIAVLFVPPLFALLERFAEWIVRSVRRRGPASQT